MSNARQVALAALDASASVDNFRGAIDAAVTTFLADLATAESPVNSAIDAAVIAQRAAYDTAQAYAVTTRSTDNPGFSSGAPIMSADVERMRVRAAIRGAFAPATGAVGAIAWRP